MSKDKTAAQIELEMARQELTKLQKAETSRAKKAEDARTRRKRDQARASMLDVKPEPEVMGELDPNKFLPDVPESSANPTKHRISGHFSREAVLGEGNEVSVPEKGLDSPGPSI